MKPSNLEEKHKAWLVEHRHDGCIDEVVDLFNEAFPDRPISYTGVCAFLRRNKLSGGSRNVGLEPGEREWCKERSLDITELEECVDDFFERFPDSTATRGRVRCTFRGMRRGKLGGKHQFQVGNVPANNHPVGTEREWSDGHVYVKFREPMKTDRHGHKCWMPKSRMVWEQANGMKVPDGHVIRFADGDNRNFDPDNLVPLPRKVATTILAMHLDYHDRDSLMLAADIAALTMETKAKCEEAGVSWRVAKNLARKAAMEND